MATFISLGSNCYVSWTLRKAGLQNQSYAFDWINSFKFNDLIRYIDNFSEDIFLNMEKSPVNVDKDKNDSYFIKEYNFRLPHEHDIKKDITFPEIAEKYKRRYNRLKDVCQNSDDIIFLRVVAHRCYDLAPETENDFSDYLEYVRVLNNFCGHSNYKLCLLSEKGWPPPPATEIQNIIKLNLEVPFENGFFNLVNAKEQGAEAITLFSNGLENLKNYLSDNNQKLKYPFSLG